MYKFLPSKKFLIILGSITLALVIIFLFSFFKKPKTIAVKNTPESTQAKTQEFMALDTDSDGLKDWEEALWKTDPKKTDSDSDGTSDGEEVRINRDPTTANTAKLGATPSDQADMQVIERNKKIDEDFAKLSQTDQLARTFFSQYIASKSADGASLSKTNKQIILDTAIAKTQILSIPKYSLTDIKTTDNQSTTSLKEYGNNLGRAFFTGTSQETVDDAMNIVYRATQTNDEKILNELDAIIESYTKTIAKILQISAPSSATTIHLKFLNDLNFLKVSIEEIKKLFSDPVSAISGIEGYQTSVTNMRTDLLMIKSYFTKSGVVFAPKEYGYTLINII